MSAAYRTQILKRTEEMAGDALRVMGVAYRQASSEPGRPGAGACMLVDCWVCDQTHRAKRFGAR